MTRLRVGLAPVTAVLGLVAMAPVAAAGEMVVMPYSCSVSGGRVKLTASSQQGHRILGRREERSYTACSPSNPTRCRTWTLQRFAMDCGGADVPWVAVAAASVPPGSRQAGFENGRIMVRMPQSWNMAPDDPCLDGPVAEPGWRAGRLARYCSDRAALAPAVVELPPGFAPIFSTDAIFVTDTSPAPQAGPAAVAPSTLAGKLPAVEVALPRRKPELAALDAKPALKPAEPVSQTAGAGTAPMPAPSPTPAAAAAAEPPTGPQPVVVTTATEPQATAASPGAALKPAAPSLPVTMIEQPTAPAAPPAKSIPSEIVTLRESRAQAATVTAASSTVPSLTAAEMAATRPVKIVPPASGWNGPALLIASAIAALMAAGYALMRRGSGAGPSDPGARQRDFASVVFQTGGTAVVGAGGTHGEPGTPGPPILPEGPRLTGLVRTSEVPRTREEALAILGMGVSLDASQPSIKKIVDGLRMSWHPDQAESEDDRRVREIRIRQINAAWDILAGKGAGSAAI